MYVTAQKVLSQNVSPMGNNSESKPKVHLGLPLKKLFKNTNRSQR